MTTPLVIIGCGGFGREVLCVAEAINLHRHQFDVLGFVDDSPSRANLLALDRVGQPLLGGLDWLEGAGPGVSAVVGIGSPTVRRRLDERWPDRTWAALVHPDSTVGKDVTVAPGVVIAPGARVSTGVRLGRHVHVDQGVTIGHDSDIASYSRLNPQACVSGNVTVHEDVTVGANATILQGLSVGKQSVVGAGAVAVRPVPSNQTVKGVPAR